MRREIKFHDFWKIIIAVLALGVCAGACLYFFSRDQASGRKGPSMITALLTGSLTLPLTPENISTIPLYHIHKNLWTTITGEHGEPALARLVEVRKDKVYRFEILPDSRFSNGREITSADVSFSVKRLMKRQSGGHFNAKGIIEEVETTSPTAFEIRLKEPTPSFLFLLSIPEMGIVPEEICDDSGNIKRLDITSGAYTVSGDPTADSIVLSKNSYFRRASPESPDQVKIQFTHDAEEITRAAAADAVDFVEIYEGSGSRIFPQLKDNSNLAYKITRPSYSVFLSSNPKGVAPSTRLTIARLISSNLKKYFTLSPDLEQFSYEVVPPETFGSLGVHESQPISEGAREPVTEIKIGNLDKASPLLGAVTKILTDAGIKVTLVDANSSDDYDYALFGQGMNLDFPEIEFYLSMVSPWTIFEGKSDEKKALSGVIHSKDRKVRSEVLQKLGRSLVFDGRVIPLVVRSYAHVYRKDRLNIDQVTNYDGDVPFWLMKVIEK